MQVMLLCAKTMLVSQHAQHASTQHCWIVLRSADASMHGDVGLLCVQIRLARLHDGFDGLLADALPGQLLLQVSQLRNITFTVRQNTPFTLPILSSSAT